MDVLLKMSFVAFVLSFVAFLPPARLLCDEAFAAELRDIRAAYTADATRLVLDLGEPIAYRTRQSEADPGADVPRRLTIDLPGTRLRSSAAARFAPTAGPLTRWRGVQLGDGSTRLILDVPGLRSYRVFSFPDPFRLVVVVHGPPRAGPVTAAPPAGPSAVAALPVALPPESAPARRLTVVLDPGHGGSDPGAEGVGGVLEKDVVLRVARALGARLEAAGYRVLFTRAGDVFLTLSERATHANTTRADLFISVHANASERAAASGIETYYLSNTGDRATIRLAQMENHLAHMTGHSGREADVSLILSDLIQQYKVEESRRLARQIQKRLVAAVRRDQPAVRDLGVKPGPFYVLVGVGMPAVLVELSFLTHAGEGALLGTPAYQQALAEGLLSGITSFVDNEWVASTL